MTELGCTPRGTIRTRKRRGEGTKRTHLLAKHKTDPDMVHTLLCPDDTHAKKHEHTAGTDTAGSVHQDQKNSLSNREQDCSRQQDDISQ